MKVILDTNFLIYCAEKKIDYIEEIINEVSGKYEIVVLDRVVEELKNLEKEAEKYSDRQAASLALQILKVKGIKTLKSKGKTADESLLNMAKGNIIATADEELREKLADAGGRAIVVRGTKKIAFE